MSCRFAFYLSCILYVLLFINFISYLFYVLSILYFIYSASYLFYISFVLYLIYFVSQNLDRFLTLKLYLDIKPYIGTSDT